MKLRIVRFLRTKDYDSIFSGDPYWRLVRRRLRRRRPSDGNQDLLPSAQHADAGAPRTRPRAEHHNLLGPEAAGRYKRFCAKISIDTSAIQYESDKEIRNHWGDDAAIACCVSPMRVGKQMQFFAARVNSAKALLYAINGGRDEMTGMQVIDKGVIEPIAPEPTARSTTRRSRTTTRRP